MTGQINWKAFDDTLIARAAKEQTFRVALLKDPKRVIEQAGLTVPQDIEIKVVEETPGMQLESKPGIHYLVLPPQPAIDEAAEFELSGPELENVVGGLTVGSSTSGDLSDNEGMDDPDNVP